MAIARHSRRRLLVALAAIVGALLVTGEASACSAMKPGAAACATACGCCSTDAEATLGGVAQTTAIPRDLSVCGEAPGGCCSCRSQEPAAPAPKPARGTSEGRAEGGQGAEFVPFGGFAEARTPVAPQVPATQSPPRIPLYLRNERLLF